MKKITCKEIAAACGGRFFGTPEEEEKAVKGIVIDSRKAEKDFLFIATRGERTDGHRYIPDVYRKQAACVVCERAPKDAGGAYILVEDSFAAIRQIAAYYRSILDVRVVGVTGSVGKTSTKEMIAAVLSVKYNVQKTRGNFNNEVGLPLTVFSIDEDHEIAVLEMGISDFGEMTRLGEIARPDIMVITNIGQCHLENLGDRNGVLKAKTEVFAMMKEGAPVVLNGDDDKLRSLGGVQGKEPYFFTVNPPDPESGITSAVYATQAQNLGLYGSRCQIHLDGESAAVRINIPGEHMIANALAAAAAGMLAGLTLEEIVRGIEKAEALPGRSHVIQGGRYTILDDCYNANPVSMKAAIDLLSTAETRKVAVMGDMFELGGEKEALHREVGAYAAAADIDVIVCIGELGGCMAEGARERGNQPVYHFPDKESFLLSADEILKPQDAVLLKASHGMEFTKLVDALKCRA